MGRLGYIVTGLDPLLHFTGFPRLNMPVDEEIV